MIYKPTDNGEFRSYENLHPLIQDGLDIVDDASQARLCEGVEKKLGLEFPSGKKETSQQQED